MPLPTAKHLLAACACLAVMLATPVPAGAQAPVAGTASAAGPAGGAAPVAAGQERPLLRIGYIRNSFSPSERQGFEETFAYLKRELPQYRIEPQVLLVRDLEAAIRGNDLEFFIGASGFYRRVFRRGLKDLATLTTAWAPDPNHAIGTVFLVPNASKAQTVADLRGMRAAANWREGFSGVYVPLGEIAAQGFNPDTFFSSIVEAGSPMRRLLESVERGEADVAMARACTLEELRLTDPAITARFRPVGLKTAADGFACLRSTELFPNWTFVATPLAPWQASRDVTAKLLSMPATGNGMAWGVTSDFLRVDDLYKTLRAGPYAYLRIRSVGDFFTRYWPWMAAALAALLALIAHSRRVSHLVDVRTRELKAAVAKEIEALRQVQQAKERMDLMERISVVGAMSSLITHELNGPLSAAANSCHALEAHLDESDAPDPMTRRTLDIVLRQCARMGEIVNHVRRYVKDRHEQRRAVDVVAVTSEVVRNVRPRAGGVRLTAGLSEASLSVAFHELELELCITNLIKNALEAVRRWPGGSPPVVAVSVAAHEGAVVIEVADNARVTAEELADRTRPLNSDKANGLGLGLVIVRTLVEKASGRFSIERLAERTVASIRLPLVQNEPAAAAPATAATPGATSTPQQGARP